VSIVQILDGTLRHARDASGARRLIDGSGASITTSLEGVNARRHGGCELYYVTSHASARPA